MKVILYDKSPIYSGAEKSLLSLVRGLKDCESCILFNYPMAHHHNYYGLNILYRFPKLFFWMGSEYSSKNLRGSDALKRILFAFKLFFILKKHKPDIFHINLYRDTDWLDIRVAKLCKIKVVVHVRSLLSQVNISYSKIKYADLILTTSEFVKNEVNSIGNQLNIKPIYDPVDIIFKDLKSKDTFREKFQISGLDLIISSVGILDPRRGHDTAIHTVANLISRNIKVTLLIAGGDFKKDIKEYKRLQEKVYDYSIQKHVRFLGHVDNVDEIYKHSDFILALSKDGEAFGRVPMEAAIHSGVVIGTRKGATPELIVHKVTGFLVEPEDHEEVTNIISFYRNKDNQLLVLGTNSFNNLITKFSSQQHVEKIMLAYYKLLKT